MTQDDLATAPDTNTQIYQLTVGLVKAKEALELTAQEISRINIVLDQLTERMHNLEQHIAQIKHHLRWQ